MLGGRGSTLAASKRLGWGRSQGARGEGRAGHAGGAWRGEGRSHRGREEGRSHREREEGRAHRGRKEGRAQGAASSTGLPSGGEHRPTIKRGARRPHSAWAPSRGRPTCRGAGRGGLLGGAGLELERGDGGQLGRRAPLLRPACAALKVVVRLADAHRLLSAPPMSQA